VSPGQRCRAFGGGEGAGGSGVKAANVTGLFLLILSSAISVRGEEETERKRAVLVAI